MYLHWTCAPKAMKENYKTKSNVLMGSGRPGTSKITEKSSSKLAFLMYFPGMRPGPTTEDRKSSGKLVFLIFSWDLRDWGQQNDLESDPSNLLFSYFHTIWAPKAMEKSRNSFRKLGQENNRKSFEKLSVFYIFTGPVRPKPRKRIKK